MTQTFAAIVSGVVERVEQITAGLTPGVDLFTPAYAATLVAVPSAQAGSVAPGWIYASGEFAAPVAPALTQAQLQTYAGARAQTLLATVNSYTAAGATIKADATADTIADLLALAQWGTSNPTGTDNWIANDYSSTAITGAQFVALAPLVGTYRMAIYGIALSAVLAEIASGAITTTAEIDAYGWSA